MKSELDWSPQVNNVSFALAICLYVCLCVYVYVCLSFYLSLSVSLSLCTHTHTHINISNCVCITFHIPVLIHQFLLSHCTSKIPTFTDATERACFSDVRQSLLSGKMVFMYSFTSSFSLSFSRLFSFSYFMHLYLAMNKYIF